MSTSEETASKREPDGPATDSVFDFLYHDVRRVGSFLAQLDDAGHLQQITQTESVEKTRSLSFKGTLVAKVPLLGEGEASVERTPGSSGSQSSERVYDPLWANARALLDYLSERDLIVRNIGTARIGQFVLASGALQIVDLTLLRSAWEKPTVKALMNRGAQSQSTVSLSRQQRRAQERQGQPAQQAATPSTGELGGELIPLLPHAIQATLVGTTFKVWTSFAEESVVGVASDLVLKHGLIIPGEWHMLGVLDALPGEATGALTEPEAQARTGTAIAAMAAMFGGIARQLAGRPGDAFGMTPLLVFRKVSL